MGNEIRAGVGFDVHPLAPGRRLVLGGVEIPFDKGLDGWSDADVLTHAVMDALLGAAALGDIGVHFPPGDPEYKDISSLVLLGKVRDMLAEHGWRVGNVDATVIAEAPKLKDYIDGMRHKLSQMLGISIEQVSVKASTANGLGLVGHAMLEIRATEIGRELGPKREQVAPPVLEGVSLLGYDVRILPDGAYEELSILEHGRVQTLVSIEAAQFECTLRHEAPVLLLLGQYIRCSSGCSVLGHNRFNRTG